ncbi:MAG TPA: glycosyltransferase family 4 protein [Stenotrophomonas sp.]|nr:glycosyltransferase family 4 protein [Stenotrophomonas sp.]
MPFDSASFLPRHPAESPEAAPPGQAPAVASLSILHTEAATGFGGQERYVLQHMLAMRARGHRPALLCQPGAPVGQQARAAGLQVFELPMRTGAQLPAAIVHMVRLLRAMHFDVINTTSRRDTLVAASAARLARVPLVVRSRHLMNRIGSPLTYTWLPHRVITVSRFVGALLHDSGISAERIGITPPALPLTDWLHGPPRQAWAARCLLRTGSRRALGFGEGDLLVGCVAVLREAKGHADLLEAIAPLCQARPALHLLVIGDGDAAVAAGLRERSRALRIESQVHLLGEIADAARWMTALDVFALPTRREAAGTVFLEAAAAAVPIAATDVGGVPEMLARGINALLSPVGDIEGLRQSLRVLLDYPALRRSMGRAGWNWLRSQPRFTLGAQAEKTEALYRAWLEARRAPR